MVTTTSRITLAELERVGGPEGRWEIIEGELIEMPPAGAEHSRRGMEIGSALVAFVKPRQLGLVYGADGGFVLSEQPLTLRVPDVAFVQTSWLPEGFDDGGFLRRAPDLVVEIISPSDRMVEVLAKVVMWLEAGTALVWLVSPGDRTVTVFTPEGSPQVLTVQDMLDGGDLLPGFSLPVREIFA